MRGKLVYLYKYNGKISCRVMIKALSLERMYGSDVMFLYCVIGWGCTILL